MTQAAADGCLHDCLHNNVTINQFWQLNMHVSKAVVGQMLQWQSCEYNQTVVSWNMTDQNAVHEHSIICSTWWWYLSLSHCQMQDYIENKKVNQALTIFSRFSAPLMLAGSTRVLMATLVPRHKPLYTCIITDVTVTGRSTQLHTTAIGLHPKQQ